VLRAPYKKYTDLYIYNVNTSKIQIDDEDLIGIWKDEGTSLIFFHKNKHHLFKELESKGVKVIFFNKIPYHQWESGKYIKAFKIGEIVIKPEWEKEKNDDLTKTIYIDPSVAFGSGFHPTTKMILESFYNLKKNEKIESCVDFGCGTGILSIFAAKMGVKNIKAIDNNNLAVEVCKKNRELNNFFNIQVFEDNIFNHIPVKTDTVFANLYYHLLEDLFQLNGFWSAKYYFVSGFVKNMEEKILKNIPSFIDIAEKRENDQWIMILLKNNNYKGERK